MLQLSLRTRARWKHRTRLDAVTSDRIVRLARVLALAVLEYTVNYKRPGWVPVSVLGRATIPDSGAIDSVRSADLPAN